LASRQLDQSYSERGEEGGGVKITRREGFVRSGYLNRSLFQQQDVYAAVCEEIQTISALVVFVFWQDCGLQKPL